MVAGPIQRKYFAAIAAFASAAGIAFPVRGFGAHRAYAYRC